MYLNVLIILFFSLNSNESHAQRSSGGGTFPVYAELGITKIEEYRYNYTGSSPCDSTPINVKLFNQKGQMIKEIFGTRHDPYYIYEYNDEGFLVNIDTSGLFGYGSSIPVSFSDTMFEQFVIEETWFTIDTMRRLKQSVKFYLKDSLSVRTDFTYNTSGRMVTEIVSYKENNGSYIISLTKIYEYNELDLLHKVIRRDEDQILDIRELKYYSTN